MGQHTAPGTGNPEPDRGFWVRLGVGAVVAVLAGVFLLSRWLGGSDSGAVQTRATPRSTATSTTSASTPTASAGASASSPAASASPTPSPTPTKRPPTLAFTVRYPAYITVRVPGGRTLVSKLFRKGASRSFDNKVLQVVNGRPDAVRFVVNGTPRKPGPSGQTETFTVRRKPAA